MKKLLALLTLLSFGICVSYAQLAPKAAPVIQPPTTTESQQANPPGYTPQTPITPVSEPLYNSDSSDPVRKSRSVTEIYLSIAVLVFGFLILLLQFALLFKMKQGWGVNSTRLAGMTIVIVSGLFLITAGYTESQIAPMIGLLGTIAGYLMGKSDLKGA